MQTFNYPYTVPQVILSKEICEATGMDKVFYQNSGAEANEAMIKIARKWGIENIGPDAWHIITAKASFHGRTFGSMTATGQPDSAIQKGFGDLVLASPMLSSTTCRPSRRLCRGQDLRHHVRACSGRGRRVPRHRRVHPGHP